MSDAKTVETTNGAGAAAILSAGVGGLALGVLALLGDAVPAVAKALTFWTPTGPLSGVTTMAIAIWLVVWAALANLWRNRSVNMRVVGVALVLLMLSGLVMTFPPAMDFIQGK
jgi:hypothetical protein